MAEEAERGEEAAEDQGSTPGDLMEDDAAADEEEEPSGDEEEARAAKVRRAPKGPTQLEREQHEALHLPYRDWCGHCVRGAGETTPHRRKSAESEEEKANKVPRMVLNYHFMSTRDAEQMLRG